MSYAVSSDRAQIPCEQAPTAALSEFGFTALRTIAAHAEQIKQMEQQLSLQRERIRELERELVMARRSAQHATHPRRSRFLPRR